MSDSTERGRGVSITIKYGKGYDETWAGFTGSPEDVREDILSYFGMDRASVADLSLNELVINATRIAHGVGLVATALGATAIPSSQGANQAADKPASDDVWGEAEGKTEDWPPTSAAEPAVNPVFARIEAAVSTDELKALWAANQAAFSDAEVMAAYKAKGSALKAAA